ncbi:hypothetical protein ACIQBJ_01960 [Kitasatospora sp. NPDC088391]|uniref:hypothetical protein n=1 Tax=Kitasatospora sp. NPDC088391 TaxID=3364074 RepID=UPI00380F392F
MINEPRQARGEKSSVPSGGPSVRPVVTRPAPAQSVGHQSVGHQAAAQLLGLREVMLPAAVVAAADLLLNAALDSEDPVTREAAAATRGRLRAALGLA